MFRIPQVKSGRSKSETSSTYSSSASKNNVGIGSSLDTDENPRKLDEFAKHQALCSSAGITFADIFFMNKA